ncbi:MAG: hypothetical protein IPJ15_04410 [Actinomycetales bacterium]|nr:hypothetical protein [Candidatus Phosphoribacter baldrii]
MTDVVLPSVRQLRPDEVGWAAHLLDQRRRPLAAWARVYWRPAADAVERHTEFLRAHLDGTIPGLSDPLKVEGNPPWAWVSLHRDHGFFDGRDERLESHRMPTCASWWLHTGRED